MFWLKEAKVTEYHFCCILQLSGSSACTLKVTQFQFTAWPNHGVPDSATPILAFHRRVKKEHKISEGPMVVHCRWDDILGAVWTVFSMVLTYITSSDGVGPTGTFITIDYVLEQIEKEHVVDIPGVVESIRQQRMNMVDTLVCTAFHFLLSNSCYVCMYAYLYHCHGTSRKPSQATPPTLCHWS